MVRRLLTSLFVFVLLLTTLGVGWAVIVVTGGPISCTSSLQQSQTAGTATLALGYNISYKCAGEEFDASSDYDVHSVEVKLYKNGSPTGNITLSLCTDSGGSPSVCTDSGDTLDASTVVASPGAFYTFDFSTPYSVSNGTTYWIKVTKATFSTTNYVYVLYNGVGSHSIERSGNADCTAWTSVDSSAEGVYKINGC
jgi:hypothetical protein